MQDNIPARLKAKRAAHLMEIQQDISAMVNESRVGSVMNIMIDRKEGGHWVGRTEFDSPEIDNEVFILDNREELHSGQVLPVKINASGPFELYASLLS